MCHIECPIADTNSGQAAHTGNHELDLMTGVDENSHDAVEAPVHLEDSPLPSPTPSNIEDNSLRASIVASAASSSMWHNGSVLEAKPLDGPAPSDTDQDSCPLLDLPSVLGARPVLNDNSLGEFDAGSKSSADRFESK